MLGAKFFSAAALMTALVFSNQASPALGKADNSITIHLRVFKEANECAANESPMSVESVEGVFCVEGQSCVAEIKGNCPEEQDGLEYGAYCDRVKTGVYGCKPKTKAMWDAEHSNSTVLVEECEDGWSEMSVEGVEGIFCVQGQACVANINGACPGPQEGLPNGSKCGTVKTGVYGCQPVTGKKLHKHHKQGGNCPAGQSPMSVESVEGVFCVSGQSCVAEIKGACPAEQAGLQYGAYCDRVKTGVYGCKPKTKEMWDAEHASDDSDECENGWSPMSVEGVEGVFCVQGQACVANINGACPGPQDGLPNGSKCGKVKTGVYGCQPVTGKKLYHHKKQGGNCPAGQSPMSVEGVEGVFCVSGQSCVAEIKGACPAEQAGLQYGAYCDRVKTGVYGCKPKTKAMWDAEHAAPVDNDECEDGWSPMSVEGVQGVFCVQGQACVANINGACPGPQEGLPNGAKCGKVKTGVYGCQPVTGKKLKL